METDQTEQVLAQAQSRNTGQLSSGTVYETEDEAHEQSCVAVCSHCRSHDIH